MNKFIRRGVASLLGLALTFSAVAHHSALPS